MRLLLYYSYQNQFTQNIENCYLFYKSDRLEDSNLSNSLKEIVNLFFTQHTVQKKVFHYGFLQWIRLNPAGTADLVTFTEEILNGKLQVLCSDSSNALWRLILSVAKQSETMNSVMVEMTKVQRLKILIYFNQIRSFVKRLWYES